MPQAVKQKSFSTMKSSVDKSHIRRETFQGSEHLIVPIVALVEGVLQGANSPTPELALAAEFGKFPDGWNGRPITLNHPQRDGNFVSASGTPDIFAEETLGFLFNTRLDGKKLKTEAWINLDTVAGASQEVKDEVARLENGEVVEVSTGLFTMTEAEDGEYNNRKYNAVWRDIVPDHLAILPLGVTGACSVADGCGSRMNMKVNCACQDHKDEHEEPAPTDAPTTNTTEETDPENVSLERNRFLRGLRDKFAGIFKLANNASSELSDMDTRAAIHSALKLEDADRWYDIVAVFNDHFIYAPGWDGTLYSRSYIISSNDVVDIGEERTRVRPETTFVPVKITEEVKMNKKEKVDALIANSSNKFEETDRAFLEGLDETHLDKLTTVNTEGTDSGQNKDSKVVKTDPVTTTNDTPKEAPTTNAAPVTVDAFLASAPEGIRDVLSEGLRMQSARKDALVKGLLANTRNEFGEADLRAMQTTQLEKLSKLANLPDFSALGGSSIAVNTTSNDAVPAAPKAFTAKTN